MRKSFKSIVSLIAAAAMVLSLAACNGADQKTPDNEQKAGDNKQNEATVTPATEKKDDKPKEIKTIRWGTHYRIGIDPHNVDEVTGEFTMAEDQREARLAAEQKCLDELGVKIEYVEYSSNTTEALLQSVLAGNPCCDIAVLWGGSESVILNQNVARRLDDFAYLFEENKDMRWMLTDKLFGHYYMLSDVVRFTQRWPLCYNLSYIEAVDTLKDEKGNTIYPNTLFDEGKWTWSTFKDYLQKIDAYYASNDKIDAYYTDERFSLLEAAYSCGGAIYDKDGLRMNGPEMKEAVNFIKSLCDEGLITVELQDDGDPGWCWAAYHLQDGQTVFADVPDWLIGGAASGCASRGESIGIVPYPRRDDIPLDDPRYQQFMTLNDSICILKGIDDETAKLALQTLILYTETYYCELGGVDTFPEYLNAAAAKQAASYGFDIFNEKIGDSILNSFLYITEKVQGGNDFADLVGLRAQFDKVAHHAIFGMDGSPSFDIAVEQNMDKFRATLTDMEKILSSDAIHDNVNPVVSFVKEPIAVPVGSTEKSINWSEFYAATDNADGVMSMDQFSIVWKGNFTADIFNKVGYYERALEGTFTDKAGNKDHKTASIYVYNPNNKVAPTLTVNTAAPTVELNADVAAITWVGENGFILKATDADGLNVSANISVDTSALDVSKAGTYEVKVTVTDFAGNKAERTVKVTVK